MARVLVTGGTGFIGRCLTQRLLDREWDVRRLLHRVQADEFVPVTDGIVGSLHDLTALREAVQGVDAVVHLAGRTLGFGRREFFLDNATGTRNIAEACARRLTPPVLVHISSLAAAGPSTLTQPVDESVVPRPTSHYGKSKLAGEEAVRRVADSLPVTIVRPPGVFGPGDRHTLLMLHLARRGFFVVAGLRTIHVSLVFVDDLCEAIVRAIGRGERLCDASAEGSMRDRGVYHTAFERPLELGEYARHVARFAGAKRMRVIRVPLPLARIGTAVQELFARVQGRQTLVNFDKLREAKSRFWTCTSAKAKVHGLFDSPASFEDRLRETIHWFQATGRLESADLAGQW